MAELNIPDMILADDALRYIALRHHAAVGEVLHSYVVRQHGSSLIDETTVGLEDNEIQIIHDLIRMYDKQQEGL